MIFFNHYFSGANQLLWYYADLEKKRCYANMAEESAATTESFLSGNISKANISGYANPIQQDINHCLAWRRFAK